MKSIVKCDKAAGKVDIAWKPPTAPEAAGLSIGIAGNRGRIALFGLHPEADINPLKILRKGIPLVGDASQGDRRFVRAVKWGEGGNAPAAPLVKRRCRFDQCRQALESNRSKDALEVLFES